MTDDWGITCGMQANADDAVAKEGAGTTRGSLGIGTVRCTFCFGMVLMF